MKEFLPILSRSPLFAAMTPEDVLSMLHCLSATRRACSKGDWLLRAGEVATAFGLVLEGSVHVVQEDFWGNNNILAEIGQCGVFAESYACSPQVPLGVSVIANEATEVLFLDVRRALTTCSASCGFHSRLIRNLVGMLAAKNLHLNEKLQHVTQRTTREKLLSYLSAESQRKGVSNFEIPFNRQQLADFLAVDRSALSSELGKLRDEGVLRFERNHFALLA